jgi:hypothetical protein
MEWDLSLIYAQYIVSVQTSDVTVKLWKLRDLNKARSVSIKIFLLKECVIRFLYNSIE